MISEHLVIQDCRQVLSVQMKWDAVNQVPQTPPHQLIPSLLFTCVVYVWDMHVIECKRTSGVLCYSFLPLRWSLSPTASGSQ